MKYMVRLYNKLNIRQLPPPIGGGNDIIYDASLFIVLKEFSLLHLA